MSKARLKAISEAIRQNRFAEARDQATDLVHDEPQNYTAITFLGLAHEKLNQLDDAERAFRQACHLQPRSPQAWQGLVKVYEKQVPASLPRYHEAARQLATLLAEADEAAKCRETVEHYVDLARTHGSQAQLVEALALLTPETDFYPTLEAHIPHPAQTYDTMAQLVEADEKRRVNTLIGERRTRIGARLRDVTLEAKREVMARSPREHIYRQIINWTYHDDVRRTYEEKLLQYTHEQLLTTPAAPGHEEEKARAREKVMMLARDMVTIQHPYQLAWDITIDWQDYQHVSEWDVTILRDYLRFFRASDTAKVLSAFLKSPLSPFPPEEKPKTKANQGPANSKSSSTTDSESDEEDSDDDGGGVPAFGLSEEDLLAQMLEGITTAESLLAFRLVAQYCHHREDYETNVELMRRALVFLEGEREKTGLAFVHVQAVFQIHLASALIYHQSPRNHAEARQLFERVLERDPTSTEALIGVGLIWEEEQDYAQAADFLGRARARDPTNVKVRSEAAWVQLLRGRGEEARLELEQCLPLVDRTTKAGLELLGLTYYRMGMCVWAADASRAARKRRKGGAYMYFLTALKHHVALAPAYTSLGLYYMDYARDTTRGRRCLQKAVELSRSEIEAAERLAQSFADEADWDRVELVAKHVVDSGRVKPPPGSKRKGVAWPFIALGVAALNKKEYAASIAHFQAALRLAPDHYHSWVALGEGYYHSGRYMAATKAILHAESLPAHPQRQADTNDESEDQQMTTKPLEGDKPWFTKYLLGNIQRELGEHEEAISLYRSVLAQCPGEAGVLIALMQTLAEVALVSLDRGLLGRAVDYAEEVLALATGGDGDDSVPPEVTGASFNFWKYVGDACSVFVTVQSRLSSFPARAVEALLRDRLPTHPTAAHYDALYTDVDGVTVDEPLGDSQPAAAGHPSSSDRQDLDGPNSSGLSRNNDLLRKTCHVMIRCFKRAIGMAMTDIHSQAVAHYNLGWAEYLTHRALSEADVSRSETETETAGPYLQAAVRAFKRAIEMEAGNATFWNALGIVTSRMNARVAQHAFVRSLHIHERSAEVWTNLGVLALLQHDVGLARDAFTRAQSHDPEYAPAWLGQAYVALALGGGGGQAQTLAAHAMDLGTTTAASVPLIRKLFSLLQFDRLVDTSVSKGPATGSSLGSTQRGPREQTLLSPYQDEHITNIVQPLYALGQVLRLRPDDLLSAHLYTLFQERLQDYDRAVATLEGICERLEAEYEESESAVALGRFALAKVDLARSYLAARDFAAAEECGEMALSLTSEVSEGEMRAAVRSKARLSAHLTVGLAYHYEGKVEEALSALETAVGEAGSLRNEATHVLAQVLWSTGHAAHRERARNLLWDVVGGGGDGQHGPEIHVPSVLALGAMALVDDDVETQEAVAAELATVLASHPPRDEAKIRAFLADLGRLGRVPVDRTDKRLERDTTGPDQGEDQGQDEPHDPEREQEQARQQRQARDKRSATQAEVILFPYRAQTWTALAVEAAV